MDVVDYLVVGAAYEPVFISNSDDIMYGALLNRLGIHPTVVNSKCTLLVIHNGTHGKYKDYHILPKHVCVYHHIKMLNEYKEALQYFGKRINSSLSFC